MAAPPSVPDQPPPSEPTTRRLTADLVASLNALHKRGLGYDDYQFGWCVDCVECRQQWPCKTAQLVASFAAAEEVIG